MTSVTASADNSANGLCRVPKATLYDMIQIAA
jgi:hypothetical protein